MTKDEDILTDLSKIKGLNVFPRTTVLAYRDQKATAAQICQQLRADFALEGSLRRAGNRLRINAQLIDAGTGFPAWSERYDREMSDIFEVQDEIAHKIAEALRITLTPQEQAALAAKPTENLQAYDLYLRGRSYARRNTRQDMEFALQMFENAVMLDANFAMAYAAIANGCAQAHYWTGLDASWIDRAQSASLRAVALAPEVPEVLLSQAWILYSRGAHEDALRFTRAAIARNRECEGAYDLLVRALFAAGSYQQVAEVAEEALGAAGSDYNVYIPILNAMSALGKLDAARNVRLRLIQALENHIREVPEDARARLRVRRCARAAGQRLRGGEPPGGGGARGQPGHDPAPERAHGALQRRLHVLLPGPQERRARRAAQGLERRLPGRRMDAPRSRPATAAWGAGVRTVVSGEAGGHVAPRVPPQKDRATRVSPGGASEMRKGSAGYRATARALMRPQVVGSTGTGRCWMTKTVVPLAISWADRVNSTTASMLPTPTPSGMNPGPAGLDSVDGVDVKAGEAKALIRVANVVPPL
jgi:tetratricopeptide (TPR) repeat protein